MKIYHTETQADYDSLMVELEEQGAKWSSGTNPTEANHWSEFKRQTGIKLQDHILTYHGIEYFERVNPETPIIKYTAKKEVRLPEWVKRLVKDQNVALCEYSVAELNRNMNAKAHGYDEVPVVADKDEVETTMSFEEVMALLANDVEVETDTPHTNGKNDMINQPSHYVGNQGLEVEEVLQNFIPRYENPYVGHRIASAIEYLLRSPLKNQRQDIEKAGKNIRQALAYLDMMEEEE